MCHGDRIVRRYRSMQRQMSLAGDVACIERLPLCLCECKEQFTMFDGGGGREWRINDVHLYLNTLRDPVVTVWTITVEEAGIDPHVTIVLRWSLICPERDYYLILICANNNTGRLIEWIHNSFWSPALLCSACCCGDRMRDCIIKWIGIIVLQMSFSGKYWRVNHLDAVWIGRVLTWKWKKNDILWIIQSDSQDGQ